MREIFKGFLTLRLIGFMPLAIIILALLGVSALSRGSVALGIVALAAVPVVAVAGFGLFLSRRARGRAR